MAKSDLYVGNEYIGDVYAGNQIISQIYKGDTLCYNVYYDGEKLLEETTAGTYSFTPRVKGLYEIVLVGGAGNSMARSKNYDKWSNQAGTGGSGAGYKGRLFLEGETTINISVGANTVDSTLSIDGVSGSIVCGAGTSAWHGGGSSVDTRAGVGGVYTNTLDIEQDIIDAGNGINGYVVGGKQNHDTAYGNSFFGDNLGRSTSITAGNGYTTTIAGGAGGCIITYVRHSTGD